MASPDRVVTVISIRTTRYSAFFRRLLGEFGRRADAHIEIDGRVYHPSDVDALLVTWCTNAEIRATRNFRMMLEGRRICEFHDDPSETVLDASMHAFVSELAQEKIVRFTTLRVHPSLWSRLLGLGSALWTRLSGRLRSRPS